MGTPRHAKIAAPRGAETQIFRAASIIPVSRRLPLGLKELCPSYCELTMVQVVAWPWVETLEVGPVGNVSPFLINIVTEGVVLHLYGPLVEQVSPDLPLAETVVCVCVSLIVISP
jgi:hypothetical protein